MGIQKCSEPLKAKAVQQLSGCATATATFQNHTCGQAMLFKACLRFKTCFDCFEVLKLDNSLRFFPFPFRCKGLQLEPWLKPFHWAVPEPTCSYCALESRQRPRRISKWQNLWRNPVYLNSPSLKELFVEFDTVPRESMWRIHVKTDICSKVM